MNILCLAFFGFADKCWLGCVCATSVSTVKCRRLITSLDGKDIVPIKTKPSRSKELT